MPIEAPAGVGSVTLATIGPNTRVDLWSDGQLACQACGVAARHRPLQRDVQGCLHLRLLWRQGAVLTTDDRGAEFVWSRGRGRTRSETPAPLVPPVAERSGLDVLATAQAAQILGWDVADPRIEPELWRDNATELYAHIEKLGYAIVQVGRVVAALPEPTLGRRGQRVIDLSEEP